MSTIFGSPIRSYSRLAVSPVRAYYGGATRIYGGYAGFLSPYRSYIGGIRRIPAPCNNEEEQAEEQAEDNASQAEGEENEANAENEENAEENAENEENCEENNECNKTVIKSFGGYYGLGAWGGRRILASPIRRFGGVRRVWASPGRLYRGFGGYW